MFRRIPRVKQHDATDCGAACLKSVAAYHGVGAPLGRIRQYASTDRVGTNVLGMVEAAGRLDFAAKGVKGPPESLRRVPLPAIAHVVLPEGRPHYVVVYAADVDRVVVMDPDEGRVRRLSASEFEALWSGALILLAPGEDFEPRDDTTALPLRFWRLIRPHRTVMGQALVGAVLYTVLGLAIAVYVQQLIDNVIVEGDRGLLHRLSLLMIGLLIAQMYLGVMKGLLTLRTGQKIDGTLILGYYKHLLRLPQRFFDTMRVGEIIARVNDAVKIRAFINDTAIDLVVSFLVVFFSLGLMLVYSWRLGLLVSALVPAYGVIYWIANRVNRRTQRELMERGADLESQLVESLGGVTTIKRFGLEAHANLETERRFTRLLESVYTSGVNASFSIHGTRLVSGLVTVALLWVGAGMVLSQVLTTGELMSCYALVGYLSGPVSRLVLMNRGMQDALIAADRLFEIMDLEREEARGRIQLTRDDLGDIRLDGVTFSYGTRRRVFDGLSLVIPKGRTTGIVGESGSGKSTLLALLQGLYPLESGRITIGDLDIGDIERESLRRLVAAVPQDVTLFSGSVIDNVALGSADPDRQRVLDLCRELGLGELADILPDGFDTHLGERGMALSGGQRQRIAIARALYRDPGVLVLDEATAALDSLSEERVQGLLRRFQARDRTVVIMAHRLATVMRADRIILLASGRVTEQGTHDELLARDGLYRRLWRQQYPRSPLPTAMTID